MRIRVIALTIVLFAASAAFLGAALAAPAAAPPVWINEFMADNDTVIADEHGEYDDVIELYNAGPDPVALGGMYLSDDLANPTKFRITDTLAIPAGGYLLFWADSTPAQGAQHTNFALSKGGESIGLFDTDANGNAPVDTVSFGPQATDVSEGRCPDAGARWIAFPTPTIGASNEPCGTPPAIAGTGHAPAFPAAGQPVQVSTTIVDDGTLVDATLWYSAGVAYAALPLQPLGGDAYAAEIPGRPDGTWVQYYVSATDDGGWTATDPAGAPARAYSYVAGYEPPPLALNELMADNATTLEDPDEPGEHPDWLELHNLGDAPLDLGGLALTDDPGQPAQYLIPAGVTLPAGGFLVFYADGEPAQGPLHTPFKLSAGGESVGVYGAGGRVRIDGVAFPALGTDASYGRTPDGDGAWGLLPCATPGRSNAACFRAWLPLVARSAAAPPLPLRLDCGSAVPYTAADGTAYLPDRAWADGASYGYVGGSADLPTDWWEGNPVGGTADALLYKTQRRGWQEYRVSRIPNGEYLLTLRFQEQVVHGPGLSVFDLSIEGQAAVAALDVHAAVGRYYALDRRFAVTVADGELNLVATKVAGEAHLAALELAPRARDAVPPGAPAGLAATPSYGAVLLDWADNPEEDVAGYHVYRAEQAGGPWVRLTQAEPAYRSRAQDGPRAAGVPGWYRVSAVDAYGNEGAPGEAVQAAALDPAQAALPLFRLEVQPQHLAVLYADPLADTRVPGVFTYQGGPLAVEVRFRGGLGRTFDKKSWKVVFPANSPFPLHDRINVNANWLDPALIRAKLANDLFAAGGLRPPQAEMVLLSLNGEYMGVYTRNEQVDEGFLTGTGRDPGASIYKVNWAFAELLPDEAAYRASYEKETNEGLGYGDVIHLVELINETPDDAFAYELGRVLDVPSFLEYYAIIVLTANFDSATHNVYLVHDLDDHRWEVVPWDLDASFQRIDAAIDMGSLEHPEVPGRSTILRSRVLAVPQFRAYFCDRLAEGMAGDFSDAALYPKVDALHSLVAGDGGRDWRKLGWEGSHLLLASPGDLKHFISARKAFLRGEMEAFCPAERPYLQVNELMADNRATLQDPADGDWEGWFEVYNAGLEAVNLEGMYLTDDLGAPTRHRIAGPVSVPPLGFALFWADGEPGQGVNHVGFGLNAAGGALALVAADGATVLDSHPYGAQTADVSEGRSPDGAGAWRAFDRPSPGASNRLAPPAFSGTAQTPGLVGPGDPVTVSTVLSDDGSLVTATLYYRVGQGAWTPVALVPGGGKHTAVIPAQAAGKTISYLLYALDDDGQEATDPAYAPYDLYRYTVTAVP